MLEVHADVDDGCEEQQRADHVIETVEVFAQLRPVRSQLVSSVGQHVAPRPGAEKCVDVELPEVHAGDTGGKCDEGADHRKQAAEEYGPLPVALEPAVGHLHLAARDQNVFSILQQKRPPAPHAGVIGHNRADVAAERARRGYPEQAESSRIGEVSGEGQNDFRRQRDAGALDGHQQDDAGVAKGCNDRDDKGAEEL